MKPKDYIIKKIEGDYAMLEDINDKSEVFIAMSLLPDGVDIGVKLHCENFEYEII